MTVFDVIARIRSSMAEPPAFKRTVEDSTPAGCIDWEDEDVMRRLISLFSEPDERERSAGRRAQENQREPVYFRHLMEYLRQRKADQAAKVEADDETEAEPSCL